MSCTTTGAVREHTIEEPIFAGDTMKTVRIAVAGVADLTGYSCYLDVNGASPAIYREVTDKEGRHFLVRLTAAETATLTPKTWTIGVRVQNAALTPPYYQSIKLLLRVEAAVVTP